MGGNRGEVGSRARDRGVDVQKEKRRGVGRERHRGEDHAERELFDWHGQQRRGQHEVRTGVYLMQERRMDDKVRSE